jgi:3-deoxy-manno-octulosonate cytidylyltransferase (CMP-KDO synthetase)
MSVLLIPKRKEETKPKVGVIIQARMTSHRFPGKSMVLLNGKPVIQHVWERAKEIPILCWCRQRD